MNKLWVIAPPEPAVCDLLANQLNLPVSLAQVLVNRGYRDEVAARRFLQPQLRQLTDPFILPDMVPAVERILTAIRQHEHIVIYGDYDVDGVTASALLVNVLRAAGAFVENFLPHRLTEGYGLSVAGLARCCEKFQPQLLIAVDCGTSSVAEIAGLNAQGIDVIVLDHHEPPAELSACVALVNPKRVGQASCLSSKAPPNRQDAYSTPFASVGVAFKLAHAILKQDQQLAGKIDLRDQLDLVALGTIADLVPLTGENRILVKAGLARLAATKKVGLRALMDVAGVTGAVTQVHVGFRLGPRLNAAGRLDDAMAALELLLTDNASRAAELAGLLDRHNADRQQLEERIVREAMTQARERADDRVLVLANPDWHPGVIGIVASKVAQQFYRPTVVIGADGKGSCRSITGFSIVSALAVCAELLVRYGGHEMAAGLSVAPENIPMLRRRLNEQASALPGPVVRVDAVVQLAELDGAFFTSLEQFEPCGSDNPRPVFAVTGVQLHGVAKVVGQKHLKFAVISGAATAAAIWWGQAAVELPAGELDVAFVPELNEFRGTTTVQLNVRDVRPAKAG
ncbi:MAG: single-stranded-DNA-specific exonuclease RecJ [Verrucomicrobiota bacterium]